MGWVQAAFMLVSPLVVLLLTGTDIDSTALLVTWSIALVIVTLLALGDGIRKSVRGRTSAIGTAVFAVKLASIPFFVANFVIVGFFSSSLAFFGIGFILAALAIPLTWAIMLSTSVYGWAALPGLLRERRIGVALVVLYAVLLAVFVADTVAGIMIFAQSRGAGRARLDPAVVV